VALWQPDPTFYPSPRAAIGAPREKLAYVALLNGEKNDRHDALGVVDVDPNSSDYAKIVGQVDMPHAGDELHHYGKALFDCAGYPFFANSYHRYEAGSS
jgi:methanethiol oxidase